LRGRARRDLAGRSVVNAWVIFVATVAQCVIGWLVLRAVGRMDNALKKVERHDRKFIILERAYNFDLKVEE
jgi:hypothetical protein